MKSSTEELLRRVEKLFVQFNEQYFSSSLPMLPIVMSRARRSLAMIRFKRQAQPSGKQYYTDFRMAISKNMGNLASEAEFEDIVLHEMIHYYLLYHQYQDTSAHGKLFRRMMNHFNTKYGRHITITHRSSSTEPPLDTRKRHHLICVSHFSDGRTGITIATPARLFMLWDELPQIPGVRSCQWYVSLDPFFNRYPRSRVPKIYLCQPQELEPHLQDARILVREGRKVRPV